MPAVCTPMDARYQGGVVFVAATGPSLTAEVIKRVQSTGFPIIAVSDAMRVIRDAPIGYSCDARWWDVHKGAPYFAGERWSTHGPSPHNDKTDTQNKYGIKLIKGRRDDVFSQDPTTVANGTNSGFQALGLAILTRPALIGLIGFDMKPTPNGKLHFFGSHPPPLRSTRNFAVFLTCFNRAAKAIPFNVSIYNCNPDSALTSFKKVSIEDFIEIASTNNKGALVA